MGNNINNMKCLDLYLSSLTDDEQKRIKAKTNIKKSNLTPLISWDIFSNGFYSKITQATKITELNQVAFFAKNFNWKNNINLAFSENDYDALVITDKNQKIIWVNDGFSSMTGYSKRYAINKTPRFLQGEKTCAKTRSRIREHIKENRPFNEIIVNYKKDKTPYTCEVKIIPLYNKETTHFIAFEKQII